MRRAIAAAIVLAAVGAAVAIGVAREDRDARGAGARCGAGFVARGTRCVAPPGSSGTAPGACPPPLVATANACDAPDVRVLVPAASVTVGPSDWEAEGRVTPRSIHVQALRLDAFEVTRGRWYGDAWRRGEPGDPGRAMSGVTRDEAAAFCGSQGGRLPTEDEWIVAAVSAMNETGGEVPEGRSRVGQARSDGNPTRRYPWGDTGAVCRRAAWGLATGPCARGGDGPDTVGAHPDGDSPLGLHDLAGNVAEWVTGGAGVARDDAVISPAGGVAKGGSWADALASELRIWARLELDPGARDARVGVRCAYPP